MKKLTKKALPFTLFLSAMFLAGILLLTSCGARIGIAENGCTTYNGKIYKCYGMDPEDYARKLKAEEEADKPIVEGMNNSSCNRLRNRFMCQDQALNKTCLKEQVKEGWKVDCYEYGMDPSSLKQIKDRYPATYKKMLKGRKEESFHLSSDIFKS